VYKCTFSGEGPHQLENHYASEHQDLARLGLTLTGSKSGAVQGVVKDTLLTQLIVFALTNKSQIRRFQVDYENELIEHCAHK
jgi:hypothetical protein